MKQLVPVFILGVLLTSAPAVFSESLTPTSDEPALVHRLREEHALLLQSESELLELERAGNEADIARQLTLISFLREESSKLLRRLPPGAAAEELMRFVEHRKQRMKIDALTSGATVNDAEAFMVQGHQRVEEGRFEEAERAFYLAIQLDPSCRGEIVGYYEQKIRENPTEAEGYVQLGYVYYMAEQWGKAERSFREALRLNPASSLAQAGLKILTREL